MLKLKRNSAVTGRFYIRKKLLQFPCMEDMITDEDIMDLFKGLIELVKRSTEIKIERKYETLIDVLKCELRNFKQNN